MHDSMILRILATLVSLHCFAGAAFAVWRYRRARIEREAADRIARILGAVKPSRILAELVIRVESGQEEPPPEKPSIGFR